MKLKMEYENGKKIVEMYCLKKPPLKEMKKKREPKLLINNYDNFICMNYIMRLMIV
jgi:hypothetical protein